MPFKVKDLMIDVSSESQLRFTPPVTIFCCRLGCTAITEVCRFYCTVIPTNPCGYLHTYGGCGFPFTHVPCVAGTCAGSETPWTPQINPQQFGSLKEQLKFALEAAEAQEKAAAESLKPQTVADVEMLEKKLTEALDELRARKAELQKKPAK